MHPQLLLWLGQRCCQQGRHSVDYTSQYNLPVTSRKLTELQAKQNASQQACLLEGVDASPVWYVPGRA